MPRNQGVPTWLSGLVAFALLCGLWQVAVAVSDGGTAAVQHVLVVRGHQGSVLARVPLRGDRFAVSYRNSIYETPAEERYRVFPDGRYRLVQIAAAQLAVLEEYYAVSAAPRRAPPQDRRRWIVPPDPARAPIFETLSIAATDLGQRT